MEFDVLVKANTLGTYLDHTAIHIAYHPISFDTYLVANSKIWVTLGPNFNNSTYLDPNTTAIDIAGDTVAFALQIDWTVPLNRTQITSNNQVLFHVKMEIAQCDLPSEIYFVNQTISSSVTLFTTTANAPWNGSLYLYDDVHYNGNLLVWVCRPEIINFNSPLRGGIGNILVVYGKHFGATKGQGEVWLKDAQSAGSVWITMQDSTDYLEWSDTLIRLRVPSSVTSSMVSLGYRPVAGSGKVKVVNNMGSADESDSTLTIRYSIKNTDTLAAFSYGKARLNLIDDNGAGSYTFRCDTSVSNYPIRKAIVARAIHDWNCRTEVNWQLGPDTVLQSHAYDGINLIYFDNSLLGQPVAVTMADSGGIQCGPHAYDTEFDIRLSLNFSQSNPNFWWFYDTLGSAVPTDGIDFYGVILHELGHCHELGHVNDIVDPMYAYTIQGPMIAGNRNYNASKWYNVVDAGVDVVTYSQSVSYGACQANPLVSGSPIDCTIIDKVVEAFEQSPTKLYPNPTDGPVYLNLSEETSPTASLYTLCGSLVTPLNLNHEYQMQSSTIYSADLSKLPRGVYILEVVTGNGRISHRIIKQ